MKPIGSEKIQNPDEKLKRILEIAGIKQDKEHSGCYLLGVLFVFAYKSNIFLIN